MAAAMGPELNAAAKGMVEPPMGEVGPPLWKGGVLAAIVYRLALGRRAMEGRP